MRMFVPQEQWPPVPETATEEQLQTRFYAVVHGVLFMASEPWGVAQMIDQYEEELKLRAASYIINDRFKG